MPIFINKAEITDDEIHSEMQFHPAPSLELARKAASHALIIRRLLLEAAVHYKLLKLNDLQALDTKREEEVIEKLLEKIIQVPDADEGTCLRYYNLHLERFYDKKTKRTLPFEMVKGHIQNYLLDIGHQAAFKAYVDNLMDKANIVGLN